MPARTRVYVIVGVIALAAAGAVVGLTELTGDTPQASVGSQPRKARPLPLALDLGVRTDPEARALRRAARLYAAGKPADAGAIFRRYDSVSAQVGAVLADWPNNTLPRLRAVAAANRRSGLAQLYYGVGLLFAGKRTEAAAALRAAAAVEPDSFSAIRAEDLLHPKLPRNLPPFRPSFPLSKPKGRTPPEQFRWLARRASARSPRAKLLYGMALQRIGRPISAEREFMDAAGLAPNNPDAQVAAAVGLFDKDHPALAFSRLGPLVRRFPHAPTVHFHLGLMLLWIGDTSTAKRELARAQAVGPVSLIGHEAAAILKRLRKVR